jgi:glycosyltransferase involved in cell wall biosynthesis
MNYLVAVDCFHVDQPGGAFMIAWELARLMRDRGHHVALLCAAVEGKSEPGLSEYEGVTIVRCRWPRHWWNVLRRDADFIQATAAAARRYLGDRRWDVVHGHTLFSALGAQAACGAGARCVFTIHSPAVLEQQINWSHQGLPGKLKLAFGMRRLRAREASVLASFDGIQALSEYTRRTMDELYGVGDRVQVIPYWSPREGSTSVPQAQARQRLGWRIKGPLLFSLRRLVNRMGLEDVLDAVAPLAGRYDFTVVLAGAGPLRETLQARATALGLGEHVQFPGRLTEEAAVLAYQAADLFLLPTRALECFGLIILEAYAFGCPVLASDAAAIPELVRPVAPEWIFPAGDACALQGKLEAFLRGELRPLVRQAYADFVEKSYVRRVLFPKWYEWIAGTPLPAT